MPRPEPQITMETENMTALVEIVTDPEAAQDALSTEERQAYEDARRSVVEARFKAEPSEDQIRIL